MGSSSHFKILRDPPPLASKASWENDLKIAQIVTIYLTNSYIELYYTRVERLAKDKHYSLLDTLVKYEEKGVVNMTSKLFTTVI